MDLFILRTIWMLFSIILPQKIYIPISSNFRMVCLNPYKPPLNPYINSSLHPSFPIFAGQISMTCRVVLYSGGAPALRGVLVHRLLLECSGRVFGMLGIIWFLYGCVWKWLVSLNPMVFMIIIPIKWLFHWEYTLFSDKPIWFFFGGIIAFFGRTLQVSEIWSFSSHGPRNLL